MASPAFAEEQHLVAPGQLAATVTDHAARQDASRAAIREALARPEVRDVASSMHIDLARATAAVETMTGADLEQAANAAKTVNQQLVGGASTVVISTTTIIIALLRAHHPHHRLEMIITLAAALSLAAALAIEVPYLPQTDALCGGAAAAMVFRYWGDAHADAQEFAPLVDRRAGGIADRALVEAVRRRGWRADSRRERSTGYGHDLPDGQPIIVLLADRGNRFHYVVVTARQRMASASTIRRGGRRASSRTRISIALWRPSHYWGLVILPPEDGLPAASAGRGISPPQGDANRCEVLLSGALEEIRRAGFDKAEAILNPLRHRVSRICRTVARAGGCALRAAALAGCRSAGRRCAGSRFRMTRTR